MVHIQYLVTVETSGRGLETGEGQAVLSLSSVSCIVHIFNPYVSTVNVYCVCPACENTTKT